MRMLLGFPRFHSTCTSLMFANITVPACQAVVINLIVKFMCRLENSENDIIKGLDPVITSPLLNDARY